MKFFNASAWKNIHSIQLSRSSHRKVFIEVTWISRHWISASASSLKLALALALQKVYFWPQNFVLKTEYLCSFLCLVMASVPLCYKYSFLYDFLFIHPKVSIGVIQKGGLSFRKHSSIVFWKNNCSEHFCIFCILSRENIQGKSSFYVHCQAFLGFFHKAL